MQVPSHHLQRALAAMLCMATFAHAELDTALAIRSLPAEQAKQGLPVTLRGTVGFIEAPGTVFIQDATAGTFMRTKQSLGDLREGDVVDVIGKTFPGLFLPGIEISSFKVVDHGELPPAQAASFDDLASARFHYQRVSVEGIVRSFVALDENRSLLRLAMGSRVLDVRVDGTASDETSLVDAQVKVQGLAAGTINDLRQLVQPYVRVSSWSAITTLEPGRASNEVPHATTSGLLQFSATGATGHRVRVEGVVTGRFKEGLVFMRDEQASIAVQLDGPMSPMIGDRIVVEGFPVMERFTPTLADAHLLEAVSEAAPTPLPVKVKELTKLARDGDLIAVTGLVTELYRGTEEHTVVLTSEGVKVRAHLTSGESLSLEPQSVVQLTGIARVESVIGKGFNARPETFSLWLRSANDVQVLQAPSGWTVERLLMALGVLGLVVLAASVWILMLRRQVVRQTSVMRGQIEREAALEERQRIAREFHDTLEQELAGLSLRMDAAATRPLDDKARSLLDASRNLVSRIQAEARNLVADLRDDLNTAVELPTALQDLADRQPADAPVMHVEVEGSLPALPSHVVHDLRMIAQEAVTNALKHAQAKHITLRLRPCGDGVQLSVIDDGRGFDPSAETQGKPGHFGCMGIRERCRKIGAKVSWQSGPDGGTTMQVERL